MSTPNDDLYSADVAQRVDVPPVIPGAPPGAVENIMSITKNPKAKRGLILSGVGLVVAILLVIIAVSRANNPAPQPLPPEITGVNVGGKPSQFSDEKGGGVGNTQQFQQMVEGVSEQRVELARQDGSSIQPLAITVERDLRPVQEPPAAVPVAQPAYQAPVYQTTAGTNQDPAFQTMMQNARAAVDSLTARRTLGTAVFDAPQAVAQAGENGQQGPAAGGGAAPPDPGAGIPQGQVTLIAAGKIESVRLDTAVNSDVGGEFVATMLTGPYAGARLIGTAQRTGTLVKPQFSLMSFPNTGVAVQVTALGLDPQTLENGTATDVDRKLFTKYGIQPLAAALSAVGQAIANAGGTTIVTGDSVVTSSPELDARRINGVAVGAAAESFTKDVSGMNTDPTVRVAPGTIIGIVFTRDVVYTPR